MITVLFYFGVWVGSALGGLLVLEQALGVLFRRAAGWLPDDLCGPEGWLVDTTRRAGVFDKTARG
ncbi:hypothetical protein [Tropicibacter sp. S64]|uniref:hypothetical protein n=1 Tax=Tropicibacter sp. S64 TaxID=3415122 RepID=UPI003C7ACA7D